MQATNFDLTPGDHRQAVTAGGRGRHCLVHIPARCAAPAPVVLVLHGAGGSAAWAAWETGWSAKADREGFVAVYPEALPPRPEKPSKFLTNPQRWNDGSLRGVPHPETDDL